MNSLGESVSFGRFVSESLSWDKWSTFSQNRYVEEAERYAQPGSVAQKKAFFEAHYKRIAAAKKAAALLEQQNAANNTPEPDLESGFCKNTPREIRTMIPSSQFVVDEQQEGKSQDSKDDLVVNAHECNSNVKPVEFENVTVEGADYATTDKAPMNKPKKDDESLNHLDVVSGSELSGLSETEKPLLKVCLFVHKSFYNAMM